MYLSELTYKEAREYIKTNAMLIIPVGTLEQHGPHLPLNADVLQAEYFAKILSEKTGCLIAPTLHYGVNLPLDKGFAGTTGISPETLCKMIKELTDWWKAQGFTHFFLVNSHGDPFHEKALEGAGENVYVLKPYEVEYGDILERQETVRHACEGESSEILYLYPEAVRQSQIEDRDIPFPEFKDYLYHEKETPPEHYNGSLGYPSYASAEKGKRIVERGIEAMLEQFHYITGK